ncbi:MAG: hypothetical protein ACRYFZ_11420 [Janthinobacterium lividum]
MGSGFGNKAQWPAMGLPAASAAAVPLNARGPLLLASGVALGMRHRRRKRS